jgi:hypothetical protein
MPAVLKPFLRHAGFTTDGGTNFVSAVVQNLDIPRVHCNAHKCHLVVTKALEELSTLLDRVKWTCKTIKKSPKKTTVLRTRDSQLVPTLKQGDSEVPNQGRKMKMFVKTRWNSVFSMIDRLLDLKDSVKAVEEDVQFQSTFLATRKLTPLEWSQLDQLRDILILFEDFTVSISSRAESTLGLSLHLARILNGALDDLVSNIDSPTPTITDEAIQRVPSLHLPSSLLTLALVREDAERRV